jgi:hypothetical protein
MTGRRPADLVVRESRIGPLEIAILWLDLRIQLIKEL